MMSRASMGCREAERPYQLRVLFDSGPQPGRLQLISSAIPRLAILDPGPRFAGVPDIGQGSVGTLPQVHLLDGRRITQKTTFASEQDANETKRVRPGHEPGHPARHKAAPLELAPEFGWANEHLPVMQSWRHQGGPPPVLEQLDHDQSALERAIDRIVQVGSARPEDPRGFLDDLPYVLHVLQHIAAIDDVEALVRKG